MVANPDFLTGSSQQEVSTQFQELENREGELHLRFYITSKREFALSATAIREVISSPLDRITPIPNASPLLLGTLNLRGRVIWVVDLGQFLGEPTALNTDRPEITVIAVEDRDIIIGLAIDRISGMEWLGVEALQTVTNVPDSMIPFLRGEWLLDDPTHQCLLLLDQIAILRCARWTA